MKFFWNQKVFHFAIKEISILNSLYKLFSIKLSTDISDSNFVLDSFSKTKTFLNFSAGNSFLFFKRFWNARLSKRCHFIVSFFAWKPIQLFSGFLFYSIKMLLINHKYITVIWLLKMETCMWINFNWSCV